MRFSVTMALLLALLVPAHAGKFGVQVGAFKEFDRAEFVQEALEDAGYNSYLSEADGYKRVRIGPFTSRADAEAEAAAVWPFLVARFGPQEFPRSWVAVEDREAQNAPIFPTVPDAAPRVFSDATGPIGSTADAIIATARGFLGTPYAWGGSEPGGFDCSGFIQYLFARAGYSIPRQAKNQFRVGEPVNDDALRPGDLIFFSTYTSGASHVGVYLGNGEFIHASSGTGCVTITPLAKRYYQNRYLGARRVLTIEPEALRQMTSLVNH